MNLYDRVRKDNKRILSNGFVADLTLTNPVTSETQTVTGFYVDAPLDVDPQSGLPIRARRIAAHVHLSELTIGSPVTVDGYWEVQFENNAGETVHGVIESPDPDRTLNMLSFVIKVKKDVT